MSSVNSANPGLASLLQFVSAAASPALASTLSSTSVRSALQNASPADLVQLSQAALQSQVAGSLFANAGTAQTATDSASLLLQAVNSSLTGSTTPGATSPAATPTSAAALQLQEVTQLFGNASDQASNSVLTGSVNFLA